MWRRISWLLNSERAIPWCLSSSSIIEQIPIRLVALKLDGGWLELSSSFECLSATFLTPLPAFMCLLKAKKFFSRQITMLFFFIWSFSILLLWRFLRSGVGKIHEICSANWPLYYITSVIRCCGRWIRDGAATVPVLHLKHVLKKRDQKNTSGGKAWTWSSPKKHRDLGNFPAFKPDLLRMKLVMALWISYFLSIFQI